MEEEPPACGALRWLYETGEASDFTICTSTKDFKVHSFILKHKSPYFRSVLNGDTPESSGSRIFLDENETVVNALIQRMYELRVDILQHSLPKYNTGNGPIMRQEFEDVVNLIIAADKYQLATLEGPPWTFACGRMMHLGSVMDLVELGSWVYGYDNKGLLPLQNSLANRTAKHIKEIEEDEGAWKILQSNEQYLRAVMRAFHASKLW